jgi:peroxiredoxin
LLKEDRRSLDIRAADILEAGAAGSRLPARPARTETIDRFADDRGLGAAAVGLEQQEKKGRPAVTAPNTLAQAFADICVMDGPLNQKLAAYSDKLRELNFPFAEAYDTLVARLIDGGIGSGAPKVGERMPPFVLPARDRSLVTSDELLADGPIVVSFNRGHWCPFCKIELRSIAAYHAEIAAHGGRVVSILPDRQGFLAQLDTDTERRLTILSDIDNGYALSLGLVLWLGDRLKELMQGRGTHLDRVHGNDGWFVPLPATFVVGADGFVAARHVDPEFRLRMEIDEILATLRRLDARSTPEGD